MLHGREGETLALEDLLTSASRGGSGVLVLRGDPGVGKTALLDYADELVASASAGVPRRRLRGRGLQSEVELPFAALHQLLRPLSASIDRLPAPQRQALSGAFGLTAGKSPDPFLIGLAVLTLLADHERGEGLVCLVDDAQWLDGASLAALIFVARRLEAEGIALVFAVRDNVVTPLDDAGLPEIGLGSLDATSARALVLDRAPGIATTVRDQLVDRGGGNPLALVEFLRPLTPSQLTGQVPVEEPLAIGAGVERMFAARAAELPALSQRALLVVAAEGTGELRPVLHALAEWNLDLTALAPAERVGLVQVDGDAVQFAHPLMRSTVYQQAPAAERLEAHAVLARALSAQGDVQADRVAWHRAAATATSDEEVAVALEETAARAAARGGPGAAVASLERAATLSGDTTGRGRRWLAAADLAWRAGQSERARTLVDRAQPYLTEVGDITASMLLRGLIELRGGQLDRAFDLLVDAFGVGAVAAPGTAVAALVAAAEAASFTGEADQSDRVRLLAAGATVVEEKHQLSLTLLAEGAGFLTDDQDPATRRLAKVMQGSPGFSDGQHLLWAARASLHLGDEGSARSLYGRAVAQARSAGAAGTLTPLLGRLAYSEFLAGRFSDAATNAHEAHGLAADTGQDASYPLVVLALVAGARGEEDDCREYAARVLDVAEARRIQIVAAAADWALGLLELTLGRPHQALDWFAGPNSHAHPAIRRWASADMLEAAVRAGRPEIVEAVWSEYRTWTRHSTVPGVLAMRAHCAALVRAASDGTPGSGERKAADDLQEALTLHEGANRSFHRARTQLALGEVLRRDRRRSEARPHLRQSMEVFERLRARPWADRARTELRAAGESAPRTSPGAVQRLTPQELRISRLAREGLANQQIAEQLFLSRRTVEYHLHKTFAKLDITSRIDLMRMDLDDTA